MQTLALATAAAVGTGATTGTAAADDDEYGLVDGLREAIPGAIVEGAIAGAFPPYGLYVACANLAEAYEELNTDPTADRLILHQLVHNEIAFMNSHLVTFGNRLVDAPPIASLEARHGMALAWEDGQGSSGGYDTALQRIRQYFELPEFNHLHAGNKALLQLSYIAGSGQSTDPTYEIIASGEYHDGTEDQFAQIRITAEREDVDLTLHDGTPVNAEALENVDHLGDEVALGGDGEETTEAGVFYTPVLEFREDDEETVIGTSPITQDVLDSWDDEEETVTFDLEGTEVETDLRFVVSNVGDAEDDPSLGSQLAFDGREWLRLWAKINELSDDAVSNYSLSFVEEIYGHLDSGDLTPEQVRSPEGMARFLSGTDDPSSERFQIAWLQQFGLVRPDLRLVRGMQVNYTGATEYWVDPDPDNPRRDLYPDGFVDDDEYVGVLFGTESPPNGFQSGEKYLLNPRMYVTDNSDVHQFNLFGEDYNHEVPFSSGGLLAMTPDMRYLFVADNSIGGDLEAYDIENDYELMWDFNSNGIYAVHYHDETGSVLFYDDDDNLRIFDAMSGTEKASSPISSPVDGTNRVVTFEENPADPNQVLVGCRNGDLGILDVENLEYVAEDTHGGDNLENCAWSDDGEHIFASSQSYAYLLDPNLEQIWADGFVENGRGAGFLSDRNQFVHVDRETGIRWIEINEEFDGSIAKHEPDYSIETIEIVDDYIVVTDIDDEHLYVLSADGHEITSWKLPYQYGRDLVAPDLGEHTAVAGPAVMFDESTDSRDGQGTIELIEGSLEVIDTWDAGGATIEHVSDETIDDLEELVGKSIETILDEVDEYDTVDDIRFRRDVLAILEHYDLEDEIDDVHLEEPDWTEPEYDTFDSAEFAEAMAELEEYIDQLEDTDDDSGTIGLPTIGDWFDESTGTVLLGLGIIAAAFVAIVAFVTDLLPWTN